MSPLDGSEIGNTGVMVTRVGMGGAPIGGLYTAVEAATAVETIRQARTSWGSTTSTLRRCTEAGAARCCSAMLWRPSRATTMSCPP